MIQRNKIDETKITFANEQRLEDAALKVWYSQKLARKKRDSTNIG